MRLPNFIRRAIEPARVPPSAPAKAARPAKAEPSVRTAVQPSSGKAPEAESDQAVSHARVNEPTAADVAPHPPAKPDHLTEKPDTIDAGAEAVAQNRDPVAKVLETAAALAKAVRSARASGAA